MMKSLFVQPGIWFPIQPGVRVVPEIARGTLRPVAVFGAAVIWVVKAIAVGVAAALLRGRSSTRC